MPIGSISAARRRSAGPISNPTSLDPADTAASITLSNSNRTATKSGSNSIANVFAKHGKVTGKWRFQVTIDAFTSGDMAIGLGGLFASRSSYPGVNGNSIGYDVDGRIVYGNITRGNIGAFAAGDVIDVYVDVDSKQIRFAKNGGALSSAYSFGSATPAMVPMVYLYSAGSAVTCNFAGPFTHAGDASYSAWSDTVAADRDTFRAAMIYIRSGGYFAHGFATLELSATSLGSGILQGGTATAQDSTFAPAGNAVDGNSATYWAGRTTTAQTQDPLWFKVDLGANSMRNARYIRMQGRDGGGGAEAQAPTIFDLYFSADGTSYDKAAMGMTFSAFAGTTPGEVKEQAVNAL